MTIPSSWSVKPKLSCQHYSVRVFLEKSVAYASCDIHRKEDFWQQRNHVKSYCILSFFKGSGHRYDQQRGASEGHRGSTDRAVQSASPRTSPLPGVAAAVIATPENSLWNYPYKRANAQHTQKTLSEVNSNMQTLIAYNTPSKKSTFKSIPELTISNAAREKYSTVPLFHTAYCNYREDIEFSRLQMLKYLHN